MQDQFIQIRQTKKMGRGIFAKKKIQTNTIIMTNKESSFITYEKIERHKIFLQMEDQIECQLSCFAYFLCFCQNMKEECEQIQIKQYLKGLPQYCHSLHCWTQQQLRLLQNYCLLERIQQKQRYYIQKYQKIKYFIQEFISNITVKKIILQQVEPQHSNRSVRKISAKIRKQRELLSNREINALHQTTLQQFFRSIAIIISRNIYWVSEKDKTSKVGALIPFLELFNHSGKSQCTVQPNYQGMKVTTLKTINKDQQIFVKYGEQLSLQQCLQSYGMIDLTVQQYQMQDEPNQKLQISNKMHLQRVELAYKYNRYRANSKSVQVILKK